MTGKMYFPESSQVYNIRTETLTLNCFHSASFFPTLTHTLKLKRVIS